MICCKIVTNFNNTSGSFNNLINKLSNKGELIWNNGVLFFSDTDGDVDLKKIKQLIKKCGYDDFYINEYNKENIPQESDEINAWLANKLIKINYNIYERENQKLFQNISKGLDMLDEEIEKIRKNQIQNKDLTSDN